MTRRRKLLASLVILAAMAITLASILHETDMNTQYGMARVHLPHGTVYVKARACGAACPGELWLSLSTDRCKPPDPATDYLARYDQVLYAVRGDTLVLIAEPATIRPPSGSHWLNLALLPPYGHAADAYPLRYIMFGHHAPERNVSGENIDLSPCVRAFGHDW